MGTGTKCIGLTDMSPRGVFTHFINVCRVWIELKSQTFGMSGNIFI